MDGESRRKHPSAAFWATVVVVVGLVAYPLSVGPACWLVDRGMFPVEVLDGLYRPLARFLVNSCSGRICNAMNEYCLWGSRGTRIPRLTPIEMEIESLRNETGPVSIDEEED